MNKIDFTKYQEFPVSAETYGFMQNMMQLVAKLASLGGTNYILDGCVTSGGNVSAGTVVINGELLPFAGGIINSHVVIAELKTGVQVYDVNYADLYYDRKVIFGGGSNQIEWNSFQRVTDLLTLANKAVTWSNVSGKPSAFPPLNHSHLWSELSDKPTSYPPSAHTHPFPILTTGSFYLGDTNVDSKFTIALDPALDTRDYNVLPVLRIDSNSLSDWNANNDVLVVLGDKFGGYFEVMLREVSASLQHLWLDYVIIKNS